VLCGASCAAKCPVLLGATGLLRQYIHVLLSNRGDPSPRPFGHFPVAPAMLGTANGAGFLHVRRPSMDCVESAGWESAPLLCFALRCCFCGRMPPNWGPLWRGERAEEKPEGARAGCARVRCMHMDVHSANPAARSRTWRAGCPEGAPPGVCFFGDFLYTSKESYPLGRRPSGSPVGDSTSEGAGFGLPSSAVESCRNDEPTTSNTFEY